MSDIALVIKIPEEEYRNICLMSKDGIGMALYDWVANGTPLPKGHGDLIDRKDLIENGISKGFCDWYDEIKMADTIIEADRGDDKCEGCHKENEKASIFTAQLRTDSVTPHKKGIEESKVYKQASDRSAATSSKKEKGREENTSFDH